MNASSTTRIGSGEAEPFPQRRHQIGDGHAYLAHVVAVADRDRLIGQRVEVHGHAERRADLVLAAIAPSDPNVVWAGTGEAWAIRDSDVIGDGIYKSMDAGRTWTHMGLRETQAIGRRYRRQDEIGTPFCITVDFDSLTDQAVTIRDRDDMSQVRVKIEELIPALREKLGA